MTHATCTSTDEIPGEGNVTLRIKIYIRHDTISLFCLLHFDSNTYFKLSPIKLLRKGRKEWKECLGTLVFAASLN